MKPLHLLVLLVPVLSACAQSGGTLANLRGVDIELEDVEIEGGLEKAMASYQRFLEETPESQLTPEALRRLADLKVEREYGHVAGTASGTASGAASTQMQAPRQQASAETPGQASLERVGRSTDEHTALAAVGPAASAPVSPIASATAGLASGLASGSNRPGTESEADFEQRATATAIASSAAAADDLPDGFDAELERAGAREALALYTQLLEKYPLYERNDQVLYQMSRAYEELGQVEDAMQVMNRIVREYPHSRYMDEVQFRRAEYFFTRKKFLDAEEAYQAIVRMGVGSSFYELGLYKLGWTLYKQELYEEALHKFIAGLDHKVSVGYDFDQPGSALDQKRIDDTYRVISLGFSNLGGPEVVSEYFARHGRRSYEEGVYANLGEHYLGVRRYSDAAAAYKAFVELNPLHRKSPHFHMRVIEIYNEGGFPKLIVEEKKAFSRVYGVRAEYWRHFDIDKHPEVMGFLKTNLKDLANHYHALYQDKRFAKDKAVNYEEARTWYHAFLDAFPRDDESPVIHYQLADLLLEHEAFGEAAREYERTAYDYPPHPKASEAGYAAVYAYRQHLERVPLAERGVVKREIVRSSLKFVDGFPKHQHAAPVLAAAADDLYEMKDFQHAVNAGRKLIADYPQADVALRKSAWAVVAHASFDLTHYADAEQAYAEVLALTPPADKARQAVIDNLAAAIYKQGEQARTLEDHRTAANHFLRVGTIAPTSKIRATADYDGAAALIELSDWTRAAQELVAFRSRHPAHELQSDVTNKLAFVYKEDGRLALAAAEYERVEKESEDEDVRRGALSLAAELYEQADEPTRALQVHQRYVKYFPRPIEAALEARHSIASLHKKASQTEQYHAELRRIVAGDASAGAERTERTRYLGATAALVLAEPLYARFAAIRLTQPFERNLKAKRTAMEAALNGFAKLTEYEVGDVTAAATFYMAEVYYGFARALNESERPDNLSALELEEYELAIEEQVFPFEEKAISVHQKNLELMTLDIYNEWIDKSIQKLAALMPVRYAKAEETTGFMDGSGIYRYRIEQAPPEHTVSQDSGAATVSAQVEGAG